MISNKSILLLFLLILSFSFTSALKAQSTDVDDARAKVITNYDNFFILVGDSLKNAQAVESSEFFDIKPGEQKVWVIPQFSAPHYFQEEFQPDSIYVLDVSFRSFLREQSSIYSQLLNKNYSSPTLSQRNSPTQLITSSLSMYTKEDYEKQENTRIDYKESYLKVISNVDSLYLSTSSNYNQTKKIASGDSILVTRGFKSVYLAHEQSTEKIYRRQFSDSSTTVINVNFDLKPPTVISLSDNLATKPAYNANLIVVSDHDSKILVNDLFIGTGAIKMNQETGPVDVTIINDYTGEHTYYSQILNTNYEKAVVLNTYTKPKKSTSRFLVLFPGGSQIYKNQKVKGYALSGSFLVSGVLSFLSNQSYQSELKDFRSLRNKYNLTTNATLALEYGNKLDEQQKILADKDNTRITLFAITGLLYAFNLYDGLFTQPKGGYRNNTKLDLFLNNEVIDNRSYSTLSLRYDF